MALLWLKWSLRGFVATPRAPQPEQDRYQLVKSTHGAPGAQARCPVRRILL